MRSNKHADTLCIHGGASADLTTGINTPIYTSTAFPYLDSDDRPYPRYYNVPNQSSLAGLIAKLEHGEAGLVFSSGMAAITSVLLGLLQQGDHIIFQQGLYGGVVDLILKDLPRMGIQYTMLENNDISSFEKAINDSTRILYCETPSNPLLGITDLHGVSELAREKGLISVIDNTFASPINQNPIDLGIDVVLHSATKYLGGHSDICAGAVVSTEKIIQRIHQTAIHLGGSLNAMMCYLLERSIKTLDLRVRKQNNNAQQIAEYLHAHPSINRVNYPGLPSHPGHELAKSQMKGFGGMLSFELTHQDPKRFQKQLQLIKPVMSLGGVETIICSPVLTSHQHVPDNQRSEQGITPKLLRLSIGIENPDDLIDDLDQALRSLQP